MTQDILVDIFSKLKAMFQKGKSRFRIAHLDSTLETQITQALKAESLLYKERK